MYLAEENADQKHVLSVYHIYERQMRDVQVILKQGKAVANVNNLDFGGFKLVKFPNSERREISRLDKDTGRKSRWKTSL